MAVRTIMKMICIIKFCNSIMLTLILTFVTIIRMREEITNRLLIMGFDMMLDGALECPVSSVKL
jgi:hypothetical protein